MKQTYTMYYLQKMTFSNKKFLLITIIFSFSCSNLPNEVYFDAISPILQKFNGAKLESFESEYSTVYVRIGSLEAILVLKEILPDGITYRWVGKDNVTIDTIDGKITKTLGLEKNIELFELDSGFKNNKSETIFYTNFFNPELNSIPGRSKFIKKMYARKIVIIEMLSYPSINFKVKNEYVLDEKGRVISSEQKIHPYLDKIRMDFRY